MIASEPSAAHGTARATIRSVVWTGLGTYRRSFWAIVIAAVLVFAPIDLVVTLGTTLARDFAESSDVLSVFMRTSGTALSVAGTTLSLVFFSGVVDRIVAVDQKGEEGIPLGEILRGCRPGGSSPRASSPRRSSSSACCCSSSRGSSAWSCSPSSAR